MQKKIKTQFHRWPLQEYVNLKWQTLGPKHSSSPKGHLMLASRASIPADGCGFIMYPGGVPIMLTVRSAASLIARCAKLAVANYCCLLGLITELDSSFMLVHFGVFLIELSFKLTGCTGLQWTSLFYFFIVYLAKYCQTIKKRKDKTRRK